MNLFYVNRKNLRNLNKNQLMYNLKIKMPQNSKLKNFLWLTFRCTGKNYILLNMKLIHL